MRYIIFVIDGPGNPANSDEISRIDEFNQQLKSDGTWVMAAGIGSPITATIFDFRNELSVELEGSLFKDSQHYSGFWIIEVDSASTARKLAAKGSHACNRKVELRPFLI